MAIWIDSAGNEYGEGSAVVGPNGTTYPSAWPKGDLPFLTLVTEDPQPTGDVVILGREIKNGHLSWQFRPKTDAEKAGEAAQSKSAHNANIQGQLDALDAKRVRPNAEIALALAQGQSAPAAAVARLTDLNEQAATLRSMFQ